MPRISFIRQQMTRKVLKYLCAAFLLGLAFAACRKDDSTLDTNKIQAVDIDTAGIGALSVFQYDTLIIQPNLKFGNIPADQLSYEWKINLAPNDTVYDVLSTEKFLKAEIRFRPTSAGYYHQVVYTVTDNRNGLRYIKAFNLSILNNIGEGLVIAESHDGVNTDISHLMMPWVTPNYTGEDLKRNVFSSVNFQTIPGIVKDMRFYKFSGTQVITGITDNSIFNIKTLDYTLAGTNDDLFFAPRPNLAPEALGYIYQGDMYVGEGTLTGAFMEITAKLPLPIDAKFVVPGKVAFNSYNYDNTNVRVNFYDEVNGHFVYLSSIQSFGDREMRKYPSVVGGPFDPANLPNMKNLAAGTNGDNDFVHILRNKNTGNTGIYLFDRGGWDSDNYLILPPTIRGYFDISNAPGIAEAHHFVITDDQNVIYYVSGNKVHAIIYGGGNPVYQERYTLEAGEEVTAMKVFQQGLFPYVEATLPTNNKVLIMATYKGGEGKLMLFPITNLGIGNLDNANKKVYTGFGKISCVTAQK